MEVFHPSKARTSKPLLIYDGDCAFCRHWITRWQSLTGDRIGFAPYQEVREQFPTISAQEFAAAVHFIEPGGAVYRGAEAVLRCLAATERWRWLYGCYLRVPGVSFMADRLYCWVARNRGRLSRWMRLR